MSGRAFMKLYWGDYLGDTGHLVTIEHGAYLLLIGHYWTTGAPLPDDDTVLRRIARMSVAEWKRARPVLAALFVIGDGVWRHKRIDAELADAAASYERRSEAGRKGNELRHANGRNASALPTQSGRNRSALRSQPEPEPEPEPEREALSLGLSTREGAKEGDDGQAEQAEPGRRSLLVDRVVARIKARDRAADEGLPPGDAAAVLPAV